MPTLPGRWDPRLEGLRAEADLAATQAATHLDHARAHLVEARPLLRTDPKVAERLLGEALGPLSQAQGRQNHIRRLMRQARMTSTLRWSRRLEALRGGADQAAEYAIKELDDTRRKLAEARRLARLRDPDLADALLVDVLAGIGQVSAYQEHIRLLMLEAQDGRE